MDPSVSENVADCDKGDGEPKVDESIVKTELKPEDGTIKTEPKPEDEVPKIPFACKICEFKMACEYKGKTPRFAKNIQFNEECYLIKDPFSPPPGNLSSKSTCEHFIVIGSDCICCGQPACQLNSCSIFYRKTYCSECAYHFLNTFPVEVQSKIRKFCRRAS